MRILFIGNSYTRCNNLPRMLRDLACSAGIPVETDAVTAGGKTLEWHGCNPATLDAIDRGCWRYIVLQEQSMRPVREPDPMRRAAADLVARIRKAGAEPVLYLTWARQHIPEMQDALTRTYRDVAREVGAKVAPVGPAWRKALADMPGLRLHTDDRSHPTVPGTYLAACVFYATLFGEVDLSNEHGLGEKVPVAIEKATAVCLREIAQAVVRELRR